MSDHDRTAPRPSAISRLTPDRITTAGQQEVVQRRELGEACAIRSSVVAMSALSVVLELVGDLVLGGDVELERAVEVARVVEREHLDPGGGVALVDLAELVDALLYARPADRLDVVELAGEVLLRERDLVVLGVVLGDQRHRPVVALRRHVVDPLPGQVAQPLELDRAGAPARSSGR